MVTAFETFRSQYPQGCIVSDLLTIHDGQYVVRTAVLNDGHTLATALAASLDIQIAEDKARERAIALLGITPSAAANPASTTLPSSSPAPPPNVVHKAAVQTSAAQATVQKVAIQSSAAQKDLSQAKQPAQATSLETTMPIETMPPIESEEDLGPPIDVIEESAEPIDESLEPALAPAKVSAATIAMENFNASTQPVDLSDVIAQTDVELTRLGWTSAQGREYLTQTYGKRSRQQLTDEELMSFLLYLEEQ